MRKRTATFRRIIRLGTQHEVKFSLFQTKSLNEIFTHTQTDIKQKRMVERQGWKY